MPDNQVSNLLDPAARRTPQGYFIYDGPLPHRPKGWRHKTGYQPGAVTRHTAELSRCYGIDLARCRAWLEAHPGSVALPHVHDNDPLTGKELGSEPIMVLAVRIHDPSTVTGWSVALVAGRNPWTGMGYWTRDAADATNNRAAAELLARLAEDGPVQRAVLERVLVPWQAQDGLSSSYWQHPSARRFAAIMHRRLFG